MAHAYHPGVNAEPRWRVDLRADPFSIHHWSVWTGLVSLAGSGMIELHHTAQDAPAGGGLWFTATEHATGVVRTVWADISDRANDAAERGAAADTVWVRNGPSGVGLPLGYVAPMRLDRMPLRSYLAASARLSVRSRRQRPLRATASAFRSFGDIATVASLEAPPGGDTTVLFQVRCWEPHEGGDPADRHQVNDARAAMIRRLRHEFGPRFSGGFQRRPYAVERYADCVTDLPDDQPSYLALVRNAGVVVATTGLHGSLPWKLAEYTAMSRAVVAEANANAVPSSHDGVFDVYRSVDECVERCTALLSDEALRRERQEASRRLWREHVRPDRLVQTRLEETFGR